MQLSGLPLRAQQAFNHFHRQASVERSCAQSLELVPVSRDL
jgi:hypothetical protein